MRNGENFSKLRAWDFDERPMVVIWEMTRACALACRHCRAEAMPCAHPDELDVVWAECLIDQIARCGPAVFVLTGGDPMHRGDLVSLVRRATSQGLRTALSPSATPRFLEADLGALREAGVRRISLSIDGAGPASHDAFRGVPGTWDWTMRAIENIRAAGIELQINTTFTRGNLCEFDEFVALVEKICPVLWSVFQLVPTGRSKSCDLLSGEDMEELFLRLWELSLHAPFDIKTTEGQHFRRVAVQQNARHGRHVPVPKIGINDGRGFVFVSHTGDVFPSGFLPLRAGNIQQSELLDIYRDSPIFQALRNPDALGGKCGCCEFRRLCGGSRARAYATSGDYLGEEPLCTYQPARRAARPVYA